MTSLTPFPWYDLAIILALVVLNGVFAMSELAIVSARTARLSAMADRGNLGATAALRLAKDPGNSNFYFSAATVANASAMYAQVSRQVEDLGDQAFVTRNFYADFIHTPGRLFPPKWYLNLPAGLRAGLEREVLFGQTLFRLVLSVLAMMALRGALCAALLLNADSLRAPSVV